MSIRDGMIGALAAWAVLALCHPAAADELCAVMTNPYARLACFERTSFQTGQADRCLSLLGDQKRLACYDGESPAAQPITEAEPAPQPQTQPQPEAKPAPSAPVSAEAPPIRLEAGADYGVGRYGGSLKFAKGRTNTQSLLGGDGYLVHFGGWWDGVGVDWLSVGAEWIGLHNGGSAGGNFVLLNSPENMQYKVKLKAGLTYIDVVLRDTEGPIRAWGGVGLGVGRGTIQGDYSISGVYHSNGTIGDNSAPAPKRTSASIGGVQLLGGVDLRLVRWLRFGPEVRVLYFSARPLGINQEYTDIAVGLNAAATF